MLLAPLYTVSMYEHTICLQVWRIGLMGYNSKPENVHLVLKAIEDALQHCREAVKPEQ